MLFVFRSFWLQMTHSQPFPFPQPHERYHFSILCGKYDFPLETSRQKINGCCCVTAALSTIYWEMVRNAANNIYHPSDILNIYIMLLWNPLKRIRGYVLKWKRNDERRMKKKNGSTTKTSFNEVEMWFRGRCAFINFPQTPPNDWHDGSLRRKW